MGHIDKIDITWPIDRMQCTIRFKIFQDDGKIRHKRNKTQCKEEQRRENLYEVTNTFVYR